MHQCIFKLSQMESLENFKREREYVREEFRGPSAPGRVSLQMASV